MEKEEEYFLFPLDTWAQIKIHPSTGGACTVRAVHKSAESGLSPLAAYCIAPHSAHFKKLALMPLVPEVARQTPRISLTWEVKTLSRPSDGSIAGTSMEMFCRAEHPLSGGCME